MIKKKIRRQSSNFGTGLVTKSAKQTKAFGKNFGVNLIKRTGKSTSGVAGWIPLRWKEDKAIVLALTGDLGSGKTTFVQGLAGGLGIKQRIVSPTFIIMRKYRIKLKTQSSKLKTTTQRLKHKDFYHIDLYRLGGNINNEMRNLGVDEIFSDPDNIVAIEWAEKAKKAVPKDAVWITFKNLGGDRRKIEIVNNETIY